MTLVKVGEAEVPDGFLDPALPPRARTRLAEIMVRAGVGGVRP